MNLRKLTIIPFALMLVALLASCTTVDGYDQSAYDRVQVVDVYSDDDIKRYTSNGDSVPLEHVIQPEDLVLSPVIDIATLQEMETTTDNVKASSQLQEEEKNRIEEALANGEKVDTSLSDEYDEVSSGQLAVEATM